MRVLKINTAIQNNAGITIDPGAIVAVGQFLFMQDQWKKGEGIPAQAAVQVYATQAAFTAGKQPITQWIEGVQQTSGQVFQALITGKLPVNSYTTTKLEPELYLLNAAKAKLDEIFPGQVEIITITF